MTIQLFQADAAHLPLADKSVDLVLGSPPYSDARSYGIGAQRGCQEWIDWMLLVSAEACRVSRGLVVWVVAGVTRKHCYWPGPEGLLYEWWNRGGQCWRPCFWHRVGIPGSGGKQGFRADVEYCLVLKGEPGPIPWADNTAGGHPPKWAPGGEMSYRNSEGERRNQWGGSHAADGRNVDEGDVTANNKGHRPSHVVVTKKGRRCARGHSADGDTIQETKYKGVAIANPGNLIHVKVGGGLLGHKLAHENAAPYPEKLCERFVLSWCPPGGTVLDPFVGSGTTIAIAAKHGRNGIGTDIRQSQIDLSTRRLRDLTVEMF